MCSTIDSILLENFFRKLHNLLRFSVHFVNITIQAVSENDITLKRIKENHLLIEYRIGMPTSPSPPPKKMWNTA